MSLNLAGSLRATPPPPLQPFQQSASTCFPESTPFLPGLHELGPVFLTDTCTFFLMNRILILTGQPSALLNCPYVVILTDKVQQKSMGHLGKIFCFSDTGSAPFFLGSLFLFSTSWIEFRVIGWKFSSYIVTTRKGQGHCGGLRLGVLNPGLTRGATASGLLALRGKKFLVHASCC